MQYSDDWIKLTGTISKPVFKNLDRSSGLDRSVREPEGAAVRVDYKTGYAINPVWPDRISGQTAELV